MHALLLGSSAALAVDLVDPIGEVLRIAPILMMICLLAIGILTFLSGMAGGRYSEGPDWTRVITGTLMMGLGGLIPLLPNLLLELTKAVHGVEGPTETSTPSPTPTTAPVSTPPPEPETIVLPKVENLETLWLIPLVLLVVAAGWFFGGRALAAQKQARKALADANASKMRTKARWNQFRAEHRSIEQKYLHAETDWDMLFSYPALTDVHVPTTSAFIKALKAAGRAEVPMPSDLDEKSDMSTLEYPKAVAALGLAWTVAEAHAKRVGQRGIPKAERDMVKDIRDLLAMAENSGASEIERRHAYTRAQTLIRKLTSYHLPSKALSQLEESNRQMIQSFQDVESALSTVPRG